MPRYNVFLDVVVTGRARPLIHLHTIGAIVLQVRPEQTAKRVTSVTDTTQMTYALHAKIQAITMLPTPPDRVPIPHVPRERDFNGSVEACRQRV